MHVPCRRPLISFMTDRAIVPLDITKKKFFLMAPSCKSRARARIVAPQPLHFPCFHVLQVSNSTQLHSLLPPTATAIAITAAGFWDLVTPQPNTNIANSFCVRQTTKTITTKSATTQKSDLKKKDTDTYKSCYEPCGNHNVDTCLSPSRRSVRTVNDNARTVQENHKTATQGRHAWWSLPSARHSSHLHTVCAVKKITNKALAIRVLTQERRRKTAPTAPSSASAQSHNDVTF